MVNDQDLLKNKWQADFPANQESDLVIFCSKRMKINRTINKLLLAENNFILKMHQRFVYSAGESFKSLVKSGR